MEKIDLRRLTLEHLRAFLAVAECQSFTAAARILARTQSALTHQIQGMENILNERLLIRSRGHFAGLTEAGQRLLPYTRGILSTLEDAGRSLGQPALAGSIRIGIMDDFEVGWLIELIRQFKALHPDCNVSAVSDFSVRLEKKLTRREIDIAIVKRIAAKNRSLENGVLRHERLRWVAGPTFRWNKRDPLPLVVFHDGCVYRDLLMQQLKHLGVKVRIAYDGYSYFNVRNAVMAGMGMSAMAESQILTNGMQALDELSGLKLPNLGFVEIVLCCADKRGNPALTALTREIMSHMARHPDGLYQINAISA